VSGDPVLLPRSFEPLLRAAAEATRSNPRRCVVVGGFAVAVRLAEATQRGLASYRARATTDVDVVSPAATTSGADHLVAVESGGAPEATRTVVAGVRFEAIDVEPVGEGDADDLDDKSVLFVVGHAYALDSGDAVTLESGDATADLHVAGVGALVATKLHAALDRRGERRPEKLAGDIRDVHHLIDAFDADGRVSAELALQTRLGTAVANTVESLFVFQATRSARAVQVWGDSTWDPLTPDELVTVGELFVTRLRGRLA